MKRKAIIFSVALAAAMLSGCGSTITVGGSLVPPGGYLSWTLPPATPNGSTAPTIKPSGSSFVLNASANFVTTPPTTQPGVSK